MTARNQMKKERTPVSKIPLLALTGGNCVTVVKTRDMVSALYTIVKELISDVVRREQESAANKAVTLSDSSSVIVNYIEFNRMSTVEIYKKADGVAKPDGHAVLALKVPADIGHAAAFATEELLEKLMAAAPTARTFIPAYNTRTNHFGGQWKMIFDYLIGYEYLHSKTEHGKTIRTNFPGPCTIINVFSPDFLTDQHLNILGNHVDRYGYIHAERTHSGVLDSTLFGIEVGTKYDKDDIAFSFFMDTNFTQIPAPLASRVHILNYVSDGYGVGNLYNSEEQNQTAIVDIVQRFSPTFLEANGFLHKSVVSKATPEEMLAEYHRTLSKKSLAITHVPTAGLPDLGGMDLFKKKIETYKRYLDSETEGKKRGRAILLVGVQGAGKTMAASHAARILSRDLYRFDMSRVLGSLQGISERNMDSELSLLKNLGPIVILIDEIEKVLGGVVSSHQTDGGVLLRLMEKLLRFFEEQEEDRLIITTANSITNLPPELTRSGRVDAIMFVDFPSQEELADIIQIHCEDQLQNRLKIDRPTAEQLATVLYTRCPYNGSDVRDIFRAMDDLCIYEKREPAIEDFFEAFVDVQPTYEKHRQKIDDMRQHAMSNYEPASSKTEFFLKYRERIMKNLREISTRIDKTELSTHLESIISKRDRENEIHLNSSII